MSSRDQTSTTADWRADIAISLRRDGFAPFHLLGTGRIVDDLGCSDLASLPLWALEGLSPNSRPATSAEIVDALSPTAAGGGFLDLLRRRSEVVETITGPSPEDDAPRLDEVADLERRMIACAPRTPTEVGAALAVVRDEITDGFLGAETIEDFLVAMIDAAVALVADLAATAG